MTVNWGGGGRKWREAANQESQTGFLTVSQRQEMWNVVIPKEKVGGQGRDAVPFPLANYSIFLA